MAEPDRNLGASASSILKSSIQSNTSSDTFYRQTEGIDFTGFACNTNLPLHDWLTESKRKHDAVREHALSVLDIEKKKRELQIERRKKDQIKAEARLAHKLKTERIKLQKYEKILEAERLAKADDLAAEAAIAEQQQARSNSPPQQPYKPKKVEQTQYNEIVAGFKVMDQHQKRQVHALILKEHPEYPYDEALGMDIDPTTLSIETLSKIHDLVQRHFPDLISAPEPNGTEAPAAEQVAPVAQQTTPQQPAAPVVRSASPQRTSPRNHRGLGLDLHPSRPVASAVPAHMEAQASVTPSPTLAPAAPVYRDNTLAELADVLLEIHRNLKEFRQYIEQLKRDDPLFKKAMGYIRRTLQGRLNVISTDREGNSNARQRMVDLIRATLMPHCDMEGPDFNIPLGNPEPFFISPPQEFNPAPAVGLTARNLPITFIYAMHMLAKLTIKKFIEECSADPAKANNIGLMVATIFAMPEFQWRGKSFVDMLTAKFRKDCPVLFGIRGDENTQQGRERLGWRRHGKGWVDVNTHNLRMTGLAAGFSSISLRDFHKSKTMENPYKPDHWWNAVAAIVETPAGEASATQFTVLKYMINGFEDKIFCMWGDKGLTQLYTSIKLFPEQQEKRSGAVTAVTAMWDTLCKKWGFGFLTNCPTPVNFGHGNQLRSPIWGCPPSPFSPMHGLVVSVGVDQRMALPTPTLRHLPHLSQYVYPWDPKTPRTPVDTQMSLGDPQGSQTFAPSAPSRSAANQIPQAAVNTFAFGAQSAPSAGGFNGTWGFGSAVGSGVGVAGGGGFASATTTSNVAAAGAPPTTNPNGFPGLGNFPMPGNFQTFAGPPRTVKKPATRFTPRPSKRSRDPAWDPDA